MMICDRYSQCEHRLECDHAVPHTPRTVCTHTGCSWANDPNVRCKQIKPGRVIITETKEEPMMQKLEELADQTAKKDAGKLRYDLIPGELLNNCKIKEPFGCRQPGTLTVEELKEILTDCITILGSWDNFLRELAKVYTYGCQKYSERSWQTVPNGRTRYEAGMFRHIDAFKRGEYVNWEDGGCLHVAQVAWNAIAIRWFILQEK